MSLPLGKDNQEVPVPPPCREAGSPEEMVPEELCRVHENGLTLLHLMVMQGNVGRVRFLLSCGTSVNSAAG